ncbi:MAG: hypothetical protein PHH54_06220 [Candidatus Nanoarchaeia archaeon]|nr:hypothetical protein [Candidatus Nanoarchaeia archaeon]MDD5741550.1 hypothetical protein [Candidatus Nanoarchaeia archaeon]
MNSALILEHKEFKKLIPSFISGVVISLLFCIFLSLRLGSTPLDTIIVSLGLDLIAVISIVNKYTLASAFGAIIGTILSFSLLICF